MENAKERENKKKEKIDKNECTRWQMPGGGTERESSGLQVPRRPPSPSLLPNSTRPGSNVAGAGAAPNPLPSVRGRPRNNWRGPPTTS